MMTDQSNLRIARVLAYLLDNAVRIPGTSVRIGLDPLIGLIPGLGDAIAGAAGAVILLLAGRQQVPKIVLVRMSLNIALNSVLGAIPVVGDLFSAWFKSNIRNLDLLERHSVPGGQSTASDWAFVIALIATIVILMGSVLFAVIWVLQRLWQIAQ
jgi:hypothetical protein